MSTMMEHAADQIESPGRALLSLRMRLKMTRAQFALAIGYVGDNRHNYAVVKRYEEDRRPVPVHILRLAYLLAEHFEREMRLPKWEGYFEAIE